MTLAQGCMGAMTSLVLLNVCRRDAHEVSLLLVPDSNKNSRVLARSLCNVSSLSKLISSAYWQSRYVLFEILVRCDSSMS